MAVPTVTLLRIKIGALRSSLEILGPGTYRDGDHAVVLEHRHRVLRVERFGYKNKQCDGLAEDRPGQWGQLAWHVSHYDWTSAEQIDPPRAMAPDSAERSPSWWSRLLAVLVWRRRSTGRLPAARVIALAAPPAPSSPMEHA